MATPDLPGTLGNEASRESSSVVTQSWRFLGGLEGVLYTDPSHHGVRSLGDSARLATSIESREHITVAGSMTSREALVERCGLKDMEVE